MPRNAALELRLDRFLDHATAVRQSIQVYTGRIENQVFLLPDYDVVERVLRFRPSEPLEANLLYTVRITVRTPEATLGLRAFDGAGLEPGPVPLEFSFYTSTELLSPSPACQPSCRNIVNRLAASGCSRHGCHSEAQDPEECPAGAALDHNRECVGVPRMGLVLDSEAGLSNTAIGRVAHQTETGSSGGIPLVNPIRMGVQMPLVDPGRPGNSYLLYKLLLRPANFAALPEAELTPDERTRRTLCTPSYRSELPADQPLAGEEAERERLREWFVRGQGMPLVSRTGDDSVSPLTLDAMHEIERWIAGGAVCP